MSTRSEEIFDNWEEIDEAGLNNQLDQLRKETIKLKLSQSTDMQATTPTGDQTNGQLANPFPMLLMQDDEYRTQYMPQKPTVKILKRPTLMTGGNGEQAGGIVNGIGNDTKPKQPIKTLKQREEEYAQARLRIFGQTETNDSQMDSSCPNGDSFKLYKNGVITSTSMKNGSSSTTVSSPSQILRTPDGVLRLPTGPDGSIGFTLKR